MGQMQDNITVTILVNHTVVTKTVQPGMTLLHFLKDELQLYGTRESCSEGDCGACTVAIGTIESGTLKYRACTSCILPVAKAHGCHVITVEGLEEEGVLHLIQQKMLECHATQCGYCTPGIIMSLYALFVSSNSIPTSTAIKDSLEGNLCRCTGYDSIREASEEVRKAVQADPARWKGLILLKDTERATEWLQSYNEPIQYVAVPSTEASDTLGYYLPNTLDELFTISKRIGDAKKYKIIGGGTDLLVEYNVRDIRYPYYIDISKIKECNEIIDNGTHIEIGAAVSEANLLTNGLIRDDFNVLYEAMKKMASTQIRNFATLVGNIVNASPVADGASILLALGARLRLLSSKGERTVNLSDFWLDYKKTILEPNEIVLSILVNKPQGYTNFIKSTKRKTVDISSINSCIHMIEKEGTIQYIQLSYGGVAKYPMLAQKTMEFLVGKKITKDIIKQATDIAISEFTPISDVRGCAQFRSILIKNHLYYHMIPYLGNDFNLY